MKTKVKTTIKILISLALIFLLFYKINIKDLFQIIKNIHLLNHIFLLVVLVITTIIHSYRWQILLKPLGYEEKITSLFKLKLVAIYYNSILPSNFSGDFARSYYFSRDKKTKFLKPLVSIIMERLLGLGVLILFILIGIFPNSKILEKLNILPYILISSCLFLIFVIMLFNPKIKEKIKNWFGKSKFKGNKIINLIKKAYLTTHYYIKFKKTIVISFILSIFLLILYILLNSIAFNSIGIQISLSKLFFIIPIIMLLNMIPVSLGNIGFNEGMYIFFFSYLGIEPEQALIVSLLIRFYNILLGLIGAFFVTNILKIKNE